MTPLLDVSGLRILRGKTAILRRIDWRVLPGENWVILGANGSGKTSLLKAITGFLSPTDGHIAALGRIYGESDWRDLRLKIGVVTSAFAAAIPPAECALETVISGRYAQLDLWARVTAADRRNAARLLRSVGLARIAEREWAYLSQGERQRVLIARALMARPRLLILDEPCAGLDPVAREKFLGFVNRLLKPRPPAGRRPRHPAIVMVTHHAEEIVPRFTHLLLLKDGGVVAAGPRRRTMTSANLSRAFGAAMTLHRDGGRFRLELRRKRAVAQP